MIVQIVPRDYIAPAWPFVEPWLAKAMAAPWCGQTLADLRAWLDAEKQQLWAVSRETKCIGAFTTGVYDRYGERVVSVEALGGEGLAAWGEAAVRAVNDFGRLNRCARIVGAGRAGNRWFRKFGFKTWPGDDAPLFLSREVV